MAQETKLIKNLKAVIENAAEKAAKASDLEEAERWQLIINQTNHILSSLDS